MSNVDHNMDNSMDPSSTFTLDSSPVSSSDCREVTAVTVKNEYHANNN
jgi:hypothetical protein